MPDLVVTQRTQLPKAFRSLFHTKARYKGFYGGRGTAKSHTIAEALIIRAATRPIRVLCCREIQRSIKESVKRLLDDKIRKLGLAHMFTSTGNQISSTTGAWFGFEGLRNNIDIIRSYEGIDVVWIEEANRTSVRSWETLTPTIRQTGSEIWASWNPYMPTDPIDDFFRGNGAGHVGGGVLDAEWREEEQAWVIAAGYEEFMVSQRVLIEDNKWFPPVLRMEMERDKRRDPERYAHVWLGEYAKNSKARVFNNWKIGEMAIPAGMRPYYGADWGFVHPAVLVRMFIFESIRTIYVDAESTGSGVAIDKLPDLFDDIDENPTLSPRKWPIKADSAKPEQIEYMRTHGFPHISGARKGPGSIEEGIEFLKSYDIIVHRNCKRVIDELTLYSFEVDKLTDEVLPILADKDNHTIDAMRYAVEDLRRSAKIVMPIIITAPRTYIDDNPERGSHT